MKKILALTLSIIMVVSIFMMIPVSTSAESVLGWEVLNNAALVKNGEDKVTFSGAGYYGAINAAASYGDANKAAIMVSENKLDLSKDIKLSLSGLDGFFSSPDCWIFIGIVDSKDTAKNFSSETGFGAGVLFRADTQSWIPYTISGLGCATYIGYRLSFDWEPWGTGINTSEFAGNDTVIGSGSTNEVFVEFKNLNVQPASNDKVAATDEALVPAINVGAGSNVVSTFTHYEEKSNIYTAFNNSIAALYGEGYLFIALSNADSKQMTVTVDGFKAEAVTTAAPVTTKEPETTKAPETTKEPDTTKSADTTKAPETTVAPAETTKAAEEKKGCGSVAAIGVSLVVSILGSAIIRKKH